jgi:transposase
MVRSHQKYSTESLQQAIKACSNGTMTSVEAAKSYGVLQSTIRNHKRRPSMGIRSGRSFLLKKIDEEHLVQLLLDLEQTGFRLTKNKVMKVSQDYVETLEKKT